MAVFQPFLYIVQMAPNRAKRLVYFSMEIKEIPTINLTSVNVPNEVKVTLDLTTLFQLELIMKSL